jgi:hypothetical protein
MRRLLWNVGVVSLATIGVGTAIAQESRPKPLEGRGAAIEYRGEGEPDTFKPGATLFTNRIYTVAECPEWLQGKRFLRGNIDFGYFRVRTLGRNTNCSSAHPAARCRGGA